MRANSKELPRTRNSSDGGVESFRISTGGSLDALRYALGGKSTLRSMNRISEVVLLPTCIVMNLYCGAKRITDSEGWTPRQTERERERDRPSQKARSNQQRNQERSQEESRRVRRRSKEDHDTRFVRPLRQIRLLRPGKAR